MVISQDLAGPVGLFVKFSLLQEYGVDRVFLLENANVDSSQRNVVFLVHAEKARHVRTVAGMCYYFSFFLHFLVDDRTVDGTISRLRRHFLLYVISQQIPIWKQAQLSGTLLLSSRLNAIRMS